MKVDGCKSILSLQYDFLAAKKEILKPDSNSYKTTSQSLPQQILLMPFWQIMYGQKIQEAVRGLRELWLDVEKFQWWLQLKNFRRQRKLNVLVKKNKASAWTSREIPGTL